MKKADDDHLPYAIDEFGDLVSIDDIPLEKRGLACDCYCIKCNEPLVAKLGYGGKMKHFAHQKDSDCHGAVMTLLHRLSEEILKSEKKVMTPPYKTIPAQRLIFTQVEVEQRNDRSDLQPDIVGVTEDGIRWHIEIKNTSEVKDSKKAKIRESGINCLEIDVSGQSLDKDKLKAFLLDSAESRQWINNPFYDKKIRQERYGDEIKQKEKYHQYRKDDKYEIIELKECGFNCGVNRFRGDCIYLKDELCINNVEYVVCDRIHREKDKEYERPKETVLIQVESDCHYLDFEYDQQSLSEICALLIEGKHILLDDGLNGEIEVCEIKQNGDGIVCLCNCNDRVYPLKVLYIWIDNNKLRYEVTSNNQGKDKDIAKRNYIIERDGKKKLDDYRFVKREIKANQSDIFTEMEGCPF